MTSKILFIVVLIFNLFSFWEWNYIIRVNPSGKASVKIRDKAVKVDSTIELFFLLGTSYEMIEYQRLMLDRWKEELYMPRGWIPIKEERNSYELILYDDLSTIFKSESTDKSTNLFQIDNILKGFEVEIENSFLKKNIIIDYSFKKQYLDSFWYSREVSPKINVLITLPGDVIEHTGIVVSENTVKWSFKLLDVQKTGGRIFMKSEINLSPVNQLSAEKRTKSKIIKYYEEIDSINFEIVKLEEMTKYQQKINKSIDIKKDESDKILLKSLNTLIAIYYNDMSKYPGGLDDIKKYSSKYFDDIPTPFNGEIIYNVKNHSFKIIK